MTECQLAVSSIGVMQRLERSVDHHDDDDDDDDQVQQLTYNASGERLSEVAIELYHVRYRPTTDDDEADRHETTVSDAENFEEEPSDDDEEEPAARAVPLHKAILSPHAIRYSLTNPSQSSLPVESSSPERASLKWPILGRVGPTNGGRAESRRAV